MSKRISVQWRITILTALLIAAACVSLNLLLFYSGSGSMDALNGFVVEYKTENQQEKLGGGSVLQHCYAPFEVVDTSISHGR